ncbi:MAG: alpha-hydroxy-acid oxidizing protein [Thermoleophilaceae bacterium]|nr:alpha-hydroxy-acid oxidizing protein [Thermoleophilaceae bacterium]
MTAFGDYQLEIYGRGLGGERPELPILYADLEARARETLKPEAYAYVAGGAGEGRTISANRAAFDRWRLVPRMLGDVTTTDLSTTLFGTKFCAPVLLGPVGVLSILHAEAELAVARAAAEIGLPMCLSTAASTSMEDVAAALGETPRWYQLYWPSDPELAASLAQRAEAAGYEAIVVTLDTRFMPWRPEDLAGAYLPFLLGEGLANYTSDPVFRSRLSAAPEEDMLPSIQQWATIFPNRGLDWNDLPTLREHTDLPILVKGILTAEDAQRAVDLGVDGVIVSNHGGRQVDCSVAALDQLPSVVEAVGNDVPVLLDSGVRTGSDVLCALALGARAVLVARPWALALGLAGQAGVTQVLRALLADLDLTLAMCGLTSIEAVDRELVLPAPR